MSVKKKGAFLIDKRYLHIYKSSGVFGLNVFVEGSFGYIFLFTFTTRKGFNFVLSTVTIHLRLRNELFLTIFTLVRF